MSKYKLMPVSTFELLMNDQMEKERQELLATKLEKLGKTTKRKAFKLVEHLKEDGVEISDNGQVKGEYIEGDILPYIKYAIRGRGKKPDDFHEFALMIADLLFNVDHLLSLNAQKDVRKARKAGRSTTTNR